MKLVRFELLQDPGQARSGIYHDSRVYETDGKNPVGIHDLTKVRFLSPVGQPPSIRAFEIGDGNQLSYSFWNPAALMSSEAEVDAPGFTKALGFELRVGVVVKERGERLDVKEASGFTLGYLPVLALVGEDIRSLSPCGKAYDIAYGSGALLTTPEELAENPLQSAEGERFRWKVNLNFSGKELGQFEVEDALGWSELLVFASQGVGLFPGELILGPALGLPGDTQKLLGRYLQPGDKLLAAIEGLSAINLSLL